MEHIKQNPEALSVVFESKSELYAAYMPFIKQGALFIPTAREFELGDQVSIHLKLLDTPEKYLFTGKVVWITPKGAQGAMRAGIGVQLSGEDGKLARNKIETYLAGMLTAEMRTDTM